MNEFLKQISSYNLFNYLFPGAIFCLLADNFFHHKLILEDLFAAFFFYYFIGLVISRVGSVLLEPVLRGLGFVPTNDYSAFVQTNTADEKLDVLSEANNVYRTMIALPICLAIYQGGYVLATSLSMPLSIRGAFFLVALLLLFLASYRKQNAYISKRIEAHNCVSGTKDG
ncbi:hypothetical protein [Henriciella sp.]|uniref:hypothetical protein n=1 Tax=Henriciella sp. TaxID=1968823 RepID=UPI00260E93B8|nr:hypothetical protein [Henriciella sp.]